MANDFTTPGVYVEELSNLPPSIVSPETAVAVILGYTEKAIAVTANDLLLQPKQINSLLEFEYYFGKAAMPQINIVTQPAFAVNSIASPKFLLYQSLQLFFANGGGKCYIISVGNYSLTIQLNNFLQGIAIADTIEDGNLILFPDAVYLSGNDLYTLQASALAICGANKNHFCIFDLKPATDLVQHKNIVDEFRNQIISIQLKYGAAYTPHLYTNANYAFDYVVWRNLLRLNGKICMLNTVIKDNQNKNLLQQLDIAIDTNSNNIRTLTADAIKNIPEMRLVQDAIRTAEILIPPSSAIAGIYAVVDNNRGVWKAPANIVINGINKLAVLIDEQTVSNLNIDVNAGKSINAIRNFSGKGNIVWGARTLLGNDNEWRYVSVRRLFNMIEKAINDSCQWVIFESNDVTTWIKVRAAVENYLNTLWRSGALQGAKPEHAYFVNCGLGTTMTQLDITEGKLNAEIGLAVVRPAEFIIIRFVFAMQV